VSVVTGVAATAGRKVPSVWERYDLHAYRPAGLLKEADEAFFRPLPEVARTAVLQAAPSNGDANGRVWIDHRPAYVYR